MPRYWASDTLSESGLLNWLDRKGRVRYGRVARTASWASYYLESYSQLGSGRVKGKRKSPVGRAYSRAGATGTKWKARQEPRPTNGLHEDARAYTVGTRSTASQTSQEKSRTQWNAPLPCASLTSSAALAGSFPSPIGWERVAQPGEGWHSSAQAANASSPPTGTSRRMNPTTEGNRWTQMNCRRRAQGAQNRLFQFRTL
jgi:hypothetical protein